MLYTRIKGLFAAMLLVTSLAACQPTSELPKSRRTEFGNILDIAFTPDTTAKCRGLFTDAGSWMGFTPPEKTKWINGFCGPFSIDKRKWMAQSAVTVDFTLGGGSEFTPDSVNYLPGELYLSAHSTAGKIQQRLIFLNSSTALLEVSSDASQNLSFKGHNWAEGSLFSIDQNSVIVKQPSGEIAVVSFTPDISLSCNGSNYTACTTMKGKTVNIAISFFANKEELTAGLEMIRLELDDPRPGIASHKDRWEGYLQKVLRKDMKSEYDRIAVKSVVTLISNWRSRRGGLLHDGIIPSHAVDYFVGFWAWDSWRFSAALAKFAPELAKNNIRAMFDYQQEDGMIIDCIYTNPDENNYRDSKPPLACWAVDEIFTHTRDTAFVREMYPQLLAYYKWWYAKRDHNRNGICEFGSTDGTTEAAAWESGMDNAIRFDSAKMVQNSDNAWSFDQESVDLNAYLVLEHRLLRKFAALIGQPFGETDHWGEVARYFFDEKRGFFFDRRLKDGSFVQEEGCEAYIPLWTQIATKEQVARTMNILTDTTKFSTYIPFPTVAADNPKFMPRGYWRGPIWLDQTYFAIKGLRNYGYHELADKYTLQVFDRLDGLKGSAPIHENYGTHTGERLKAPHFSWSSAHLLMLYDDYGKR